MLYVNLARLFFKKNYIYIWCKSQRTAELPMAFSLTLALIPEVKFSAHLPNIQ